MSGLWFGRVGCLSLVVSTNGSTIGVEALQAVGKHTAQERSLRWGSPLRGGGLKPGAQ